MAPERPCLEDGTGVAIAHMFSLNSNTMLLKVNGCDCLTYIYSAKL